MIINLKKTSTFLFELSFIFLLFQHFVFPSELTFWSLFLTILTGGLMILIHGKIYLNPYLLSFFLFLFLLFIYLLFGYCADNSFKVVIMYFMEFLSTLCIYNYLLITKNPNRFMKIFIIVSLISFLLILLLVGPSNAVASRLGHNGAGKTVSYYILGHPIYKSSNNTANFCAIASLFLMFYIQIKGQKKYYPLIIIFMIGVFLCGSRKGLLALGIFLFYSFFFLKRDFNTKKIILLILSPFLCFFLLFKVPILYNIMGIRVESLILNIFNQSNSLDSNSYLTRQSMQDYAVNWIKEKPFLGHGLGMFKVQYTYGSENNFLQILVECGLIGFLLYYSFLIPFARAIMCHRKKGPLIQLFTILILAIFIQDFGSVTFTWQHMTMWYSIFWAILNLELKKEKENNNVCINYTEK